jgi:hypothetical protein
MVFSVHDVKTLNLKLEILNKFKVRMSGFLEFWSFDIVWDLEFRIYQRLFSDESRGLLQ